MKVLVGVLIGLAAVITLGLLTVKYFEDRVTYEMVAQASRVAVPASWQMIDDKVYREQFLCASPNPCPGISRHWQADRADVSAEDLTSIAKAAGLDLTVDRACQRSASALTEAILCNGTGSLGAYTYTLTLTSPRPAADVELSLDARPTSR